MLFTTDGFYDCIQNTNMPMLFENMTFQLSKCMSCCMLEGVVIWKQILNTPWKYCPLYLTDELLVLMNHCDKLAFVGILEKDSAFKLMNSSV